jgi:hypothetical protein
MSPVVRLLVAGALLLLGLTAVLFLTGERGACLGPIGVTEVECAATTGIVTTLGFGVPAFFASVFAAVLVLSPMAAQAELRVLPAAIFGGLTAGSPLSRFARSPWRASPGAVPGRRSRVHLTLARSPRRWSLGPSWVPSCGGRAGSNAGCLRDQAGTTATLATALPVVPIGSLTPPTLGG